MLSLKHYDITLKHIFYLLRKPNAEFNSVMKTKSDTELLFYLKVTKKHHNPPEYGFEIIFVFNSSTSITDSNASTTMTEINPSTITSDINNQGEMNESTNDKDPKRQKEDG